VVLPDDLQLHLSEASDAFQFDHGCQFFCALDDRFLDKVGDWQTTGVAEEWGGKCAFVTNFNCVEGIQNVDHDSQKAGNAGGNDFL
jgi:predicted NAD/FAD-dependent oxidoreductase